MFLPSLVSGSRAQATTKRRVDVVSRPAPTGGWDTRENIADMPEDRAVTMDNWFPDSSVCTTRRGYKAHLTGLTKAVKTLIDYQPESGSSKLFAASDGKLYNATSAGAAGAAAASGFTEDKWQFVNIGTSGGRFIFACNGADTAQIYDGSSWANSTLTGPTLNKLVWCNAHQRRLWVGEKNSLSAWYGGTNAITGAFTEFPMYGIATKGGYIMGMATWTRDAGQGQDDVAVFVTSEGEAIVYNGTDPSDVATWSLVGVFQIGKPIGRKFFAKAGGDLILITEDGFLSAAKMLVTDRTQAQKAAISEQINSAVNRAIRFYKANEGWQPVLYPRGTMMFVNVPVDSLTAHQYVFNTLTKSPCRFLNQNAASWAVFNDGLYFGGFDGVVYEADTGTTDDGDQIICNMIPAFSYFNSHGVLKKFNMAEIVFQSSNPVYASVDLSTDFNASSSSGTPSYIGGEVGGGEWDSGLWDDATWASDTVIVKSWKSTPGIGRAATIRIRVDNDTDQVSFVAANYAFERGGPIG